MATTKPERLEWLRQSLEFLDEQDFPFIQKLVSIDQVAGNPFDGELEEALSSRGWEVVRSVGHTRGQCLRSMLDKVDSDVVFYNEDDILARMPKYADLCEAWSIKDPNGRDCGMISMALGGSKHDDSKQQFGDLADIKDNLVLEKEDYLFFRRLDEKRDDYFFEFPGLFVRTDIFKSCAGGRYLRSIEYDLTKEYFQQGINVRYYKASICKHSVFDVLEFYTYSYYYKELMETAKLIRLLDENQGGIKWDLSKIPMP